METENKILVGLYTIYTRNNNSSWHLQHFNSSHSQLVLHVIITPLEYLAAKATCWLTELASYVYNG